MAVTICRPRSGLVVCLDLGVRAIRSGRLPSLHRPMHVLGVHASEALFRRVIAGGRDGSAWSVQGQDAACESTDVDASSVQCLLARRHCAHRSRVHGARANFAADEAGRVDVSCEGSPGRTGNAVLEHSHIVFFLVEAAILGATFWPDGEGGGVARAGGGRCLAASSSLPPRRRRGTPTGSAVRAAFGSPRHAVEGDRGDGGARIPRHFGFRPDESHETWHGLPRRVVFERGGCP
mmetsp:Transcript_60399/g.118862  ORF Transcript_60399/g.118862 Transcript_60399/m.118862 type:complete len:235 (-) Transcript_60399:906-1610(-)